MQPDKLEGWQHRQASFFSRRHPRPCVCRGSAAPAADARDKPEHDEREVGRLCQQSVPWLAVRVIF
ncbi:hypothetical protein GFM18_31435 [Rhizobium laguerreae]|nr:hypothetical protein [Rhizobium laguerreae]